MDTTSLSKLNGIAGSVDTSYVLGITTSSTFVAPFACTVIIAGVGAGGSGASNTNATGGNSAPCAIKTIRMRAGQSLVIALGAPGASVAGAGVGGNGNAGANTTFTLDGVLIMTIGGGEGGKGVGSGAVAPNAIVSTVTGADVWFPGLQSGAVTTGSSVRLGGAAVNLVNNGLGRSSAGAANGAGGSVGVLPLTASSFASEPLNTSAYQTFGLFPIATTGKGADGFDANTGISGYPFGGGGATGNGGLAGPGGYGAGGGGGGASATTGKGGSAYVSLTVYKGT